MKHFTSFPLPSPPIPAYENFIEQNIITLGVGVGLGLGAGEKGVS